MQAKSKYNNFKLYLLIYVQYVIIIYKQMTKNTCIKIHIHTNII